MTKDVFFLSDLIEKHSVPERFSSSSVPEKESERVLIVDFGSWQCRAGWCDAAEPSLVFDSIVHRWKDETGRGMMKIGRGAPTGPNVRPTSRGAHENGLLLHTPTMENIFDFILEKLLPTGTKKAASKLSLIVTESPLMPLYCRQELLELFFEGYGGVIDRVSFLLDGPCAALTAGGILFPNFALIIHLGAVNSHIFPILDGVIDWSHAKRMSWGGVGAADFFQRILGLKYPGLLTTTNPTRLTAPQAQLLWQQTALVAHPDLLAFEREMGSMGDGGGDGLRRLNVAVRLAGSAGTEGERKKAIAAAQKQAEVQLAELQAKRKALADKLRLRSEEQKAAKLRSKEHILNTLQGIFDRLQKVTGSTAKATRRNGQKRKEEDVEGDILMEFSDEEAEAEDSGDDGRERLISSDSDSDFIFTAASVKDSKLLEELKRLGFKSLFSLQEGLRRAEEEYFTLSTGSSVASSASAVNDFSLLEIADLELNSEQVKEKRRLRLIKNSAEARERLKAEKAAGEAKKAEIADALELRRINDLEGWRSEVYGQREAILQRSMRRQKQRADRKGVAQGSRLRSVVALSGDQDEDNSGSTTNSNTGNDRTGNQAMSDSGPDDGFGMNDNDWLVYRQVSREDEEEAEAQDQESLANLEALLETRDREEFMKRLEAEQYASITILDRLYQGGLKPEEDLDSTLQGGPLPTIHVNTERFRCTEGLFQPLSIQGIDQAGLSELLQITLSAYPPEIQVKMAENVFISGGPASIPGLKDRLQAELQSILPDDSSLKIEVVEDLEATWKGIRQLLQVSKSFPVNPYFNWISQENYKSGIFTTNSVKSAFSNPY